MDGYIKKMTMIYIALHRKFYPELSNHQ